MGSSGRRCRPRSSPPGAGPISTTTGPDRRTQGQRRFLARRPVPGRVPRHRGVLPTGRQPPSPPAAEARPGAVVAQDAGAKASHQRPEGLPALPCRAPNRPRPPQGGRGSASNAAAGKPRWWPSGKGSHRSAGSRSVTSTTGPACNGQRTELLHRPWAEACGLCGSRTGVGVHHLRPPKDLRRKGRPRRSAWAETRAARRRKTLVVCRRCREDIHAGRPTGGGSQGTAPQSRVRGQAACPVREGAVGKGLGYRRLVGGPLHTPWAWSRTIPASTTRS